MIVLLTVFYILVGHLLIFWIAFSHCPSFYRGTHLYILNRLNILILHTEYINFTEYINS